ALFKPPEKAPKAEKAEYTAPVFCRFCVLRAVHRSRGEFTRHSSCPAFAKHWTIPARRSYGTCSFDVVDWNAGRVLLGRAVRRCSGGSAVGLEGRQRARRLFRPPAAYA